MLSVTGENREGTPKRRRMAPISDLSRVGVTMFSVLFKVFFYFPNRKSTIWGIYSEYFLFFGDPESANPSVSSQVFRFPVVLGWLDDFHFE